MLDVLARTMLHRAPDVFGRKICNAAVMKPMMLELRSSIPENGAGEEISERRAALQFLESTCRICPHCGKCWRDGVGVA
jgi:hypothetical protein